MQRRLPARIRPVRIRAARHEREAHVVVPAHRRRHQRRTSVPVLGVHLGTREEQTQRGVQVAVHASREERSDSQRGFNNLRIHAPWQVAVPREQEPDARVRASRGGGQERGHARVVRRRGVRVDGSPQHLGRFEMPVVARGPQRGPPVVGSRVRFGVRALGEYLDDLGVPTARRGEQRGLTAARASQRRLHVDVVERPLDRRWIRGPRGDVQQRAAANVGFVEVSYGLPQGWW